MGITEEKYSKNRNAFPRGQHVEAELGSKSFSYGICFEDTRDTRLRSHGGEAETQHVWQDQST